MREHYPFINGIPSKNTFARVFAALNPEEFKHCFVEWVKTLQKTLNSVIAIDGKTLCNRMDKQQKVDEKSNEITAIPKLLDLLDLKGQIITIDAMGTQKAIAKQIIDNEGDYVLALKGNQGTLNEDVRLLLETELKKSSSTVIDDDYEETDKGHGRIETRTCYVSSQIDSLTQKEQWAGLKTVAMIEETQEKNGILSTERPFFISSLSADAKQISSAVRSHWLLENGLHWTLDVVFNEDKSRVRKDNAGENMAIIRHITLNMLNNTKKQYKNVGLKALRKKAGWGNNTLSEILRKNF